MPHLLVLCGLPFSGKSTLGRALAERLGAIHVEVDRLHADVADALEGRRIERQEWIAAYQAAYREVEAALSDGRVVVFDAVSYRRVQRDRVRRIANRFGVPMTIVYLDVDPDQARARLEANRRAPLRVNVPDVDFEEVASGMQPPMDDEPHIRYRPDEPIFDWIDRAVAPLLAESDRA